MKRVSHSGCGYRRRLLRRLPAVPAISNSPVWQAAGNDSSQFDPRCPEWAEQVRGVKLVIGVDRTGSVSDSELGECWENTQADRQTDRQTDKQPNKQNERQTDRQADRQTLKWTKTDG